MKRSDFYFDLPNELIAQNPPDKRSDSRMLVLDKRTGERTHRRFFNLPEYLRPGDCLAINDSKVIPARLVNGKVEILLHERITRVTRTPTLVSSPGISLPFGGNGGAVSEWTALVKPGKKARPGDTLTFGNGRLTVRVLEIIEGGLRVVRLEHEGALEALLDEIGLVPLPHYIRTELKTADEKGRYQTVYAARDGSVAAPTAGLHFTEEMLAQIKYMGVSVARVTLHVGLGTFRPVKADNITEHHMHSEYYELLPEHAAAVNVTKQRGGRVIAVGTTSCRTLESCGVNAGVAVNGMPACNAGDGGLVAPGSGHTDIFICPGDKFKVIDG